MSEITRHFTATTFVVWDGKVLLHLHAKQGLWLPPGGHLERDELPQDAAVREIEEETGLRLRLHSEQEAAALERTMAVPVVPQPAFILVEPINPFHEHIDFIYFALAEDGQAASERQEANGEGRGANGFQWFAPLELEMAGVPQNVKEGAQRAIAYFEAITRNPKQTTNNE